MNIRASVVLTTTILLLTSAMVAQPVSLTINGMPNGATFVSGDMLSWQITLPSGATSYNSIWIDINANGVVNEGTDRILYQFYQTDGEPGFDGPGDMDGMANGTISSQFPAGLAPTRWLFIASIDGSADTSWFQIQPLASPTATITGHLSGPAEVDLSYILVEADAEGGSSDEMRPFWHALTNSNGDYTIQMGGTPAMMNPWHVRLETSGFGRLVAIRGDTMVYVGGTPPVVNFDLVIGTVLTGTVVDQNESPLEGTDPHVHPADNPDGNGFFGGNTGPDGKFSFVVPPGSWILHFTHQGYRDVWWNGQSNRDLSDVLVITTQDTVKNLDAMLVKTGEIRGTVRNYGAPTFANVMLFTMPGEMIVNSQSTNSDGSYSFNVDPGLYYVKFEKDGEIQYYNHSSSSPGTGIPVMGTESISGIDADFSQGLPPNLPNPGIVKVWDVPNDNGKHVFVRFRGVEQALEGMGDFNSDMPFGIEKYTIWRIDKGYPTYVGTVPAAWDSVYTTAVATLADSTIADGMRWSKFYVKAQFLFNQMILPSMVDSGYSLDNLAPGVPGGVGSSVVGGNVLVFWTPLGDEDFRYFTIYRGTTQDFTIGGLTPLAHTADLSYTDVGSASGTFYYKVTATDFAGNESRPSVPVSSTGTTAVAGEGGVPSAYALGQNYPNPFNPTTNVVYDVPVTGYVRIEVFNTLGQQVAELVAGEVAAGRHSVRFDATGLPTGLYVARMVSGEFTATRKINLVK